MLTTDTWVMLMVNPSKNYCLVVSLNTEQMNKSDLRELSIRDFAGLWETCIRIAKMSNVDGNSVTKILFGSQVRSLK